RQAQPAICFHQGIPATRQHRYPSQRARLFVAEQKFCAAHLVEHFLSHTIVEKGCDLLALLQAKFLAGLYIVGNAALNSANLPEATITGDIRRLAGPWR